MKSKDKRLSKDAVIVNELGLHARAAVKMANLVKQAQSKIWIKKENEMADASSIIDILALCCEKGSIVTLMIENQEDIRILEETLALIKSGFGE